MAPRREETGTARTALSAPRVITGWDDRLRAELAALAPGAHLDRCDQCGACTAACPVHVLEPRFDPRRWLALMAAGREAELIADRELPGRCVSCGACTHACPRAVDPQRLVKAAALWLERKGHTARSVATELDEAFTAEVVRNGRVDPDALAAELARRASASPEPGLMTGIARQLARRRSILLRIARALGLQRIRVKGWAGSRAAIEQHLRAGQRRPDRPADGGPAAS